MIEDAGRKGGTQPGALVPLVPPARHAPAHRSRRSLVRRVAGVVLVLLVGAFSSALVLVRTGAWRVVPVATAAMRPALPAGAVAIAERVPASSLAVRDVVLVDGVGSPAPGLERVTSIRRSGSAVLVATRADHGSGHAVVALGPTRRPAYLVRFSLPALGSLARWVRSGAGTAVLVGLAGLTAVLLGAWLVLLRRPGAHSRRRAGPAALPAANAAIDDNNESLA